MNLRTWEPDKYNSWVNDWDHGEQGEGGWGNGVRILIFGQLHFLNFFSIIPNGCVCTLYLIYVDLKHIKITVLQ